MCCVCNSKGLVLVTIVSDDDSAHAYPTDWTVMARDAHMFTVRSGIVSLCLIFLSTSGRKIDKKSFKRYSSALSERERGQRRLRDRIKQQNIREIFHSAVIASFWQWNFIKLNFPPFSYFFVCLVVAGSKLATSPELSSLARMWM